jgi:hypothetical protein
MHGLCHEAGDVIAVVRGSSRIPKIAEYLSCPEEWAILLVSLRQTILISPCLYFMTTVLYFRFVRQPFFGHCFISHNAFRELPARFAKVRGGGGFSGKRV